MTGAVGSSSIAGMVVLAKSKEVSIESSQSFC